MKASLTLAESRAPSGSFDVMRVREDFPILKLKVHGKPLVYLDNGATSQKPQAVIDALNRYYSAENSNIHRGVHYLSEQATTAYEAARGKIRQFINARSDKEIIFVRGTTEAINLVAQCYGRSFLKAGDEIIVSAMEHHSNIVPWQILCEQTGAKLRVIPINHEGELVMEEFRRLLNDKTKFVSITHVSNALGTIVPVKEIVALAHERGVPVMLDGAQAVPHLRVDVQDLGCDFYAFSGHKLFGPDRRRRALRARRAARKNAAVPGRRRHDQSGDVRKNSLQCAALQVRSRHAAILPAALDSGAAIDYLTAIGLAASSRRTSTSC